MPVLVFILLAILILLLVSGFCIFAIGCIRKKELRWLDAESLKGTFYEKYHPHLVAADRWLTEHNAEEITLESKDGLTLHGLWVPAENPRGTVLYAHGYRSSILVEMCPFLAFYHQMGLNLLLPDQRSHGKSQGKFITFGVKESEDMVRWIQLHNRRFGEQPMLLMGMSMGASTMLYLADRDLPENVRCILADCGFTSPWEILSGVYRNTIHLPAWISMWSANLFARILAGFGLREKDTRKILPNSRLPVLLIHGKDDAFVPCRMTEEAYAVCAQPKEMMLVPGAEHGVSILKDKEGYRTRVCAFLDRYIPESEK